MALTTVSAELLMSPAVQVPDGGGHCDETVDAGALLETLVGGMAAVDTGSVGSVVEMGVTPKAVSDCNSVACKLDDCDCAQDA